MVSYMPLEKEGKLVPEFEGKNFDKQQKRKKKKEEKK